MLLYEQGGSKVNQPLVVSSENQIKPVADDRHEQGNVC